MIIVDVPISTVPLCDVCGTHAPRLLTVIDHNQLPVSACTACSPRVGMTVLGRMRPVERRRAARQ